MTDVRDFQDEPLIHRNDTKGREYAVQVKKMGHPPPPERSLLSEFEHKLLLYSDKLTRIQNPRSPDLEMKLLICQQSLRHGTRSGVSVTGAGHWGFSYKYHSLNVSSFSSPLYTPLHRHPLASLFPLLLSLPRLSLFLESQPEPLLSCSPAPGSTSFPSLPLALNPRTWSQSPLSSSYPAYGSNVRRFSTHSTAGTLDSASRQAFGSSCNSLAGPASPRLTPPPPCFTDLS